jgi:hypothetical protein
LRRLKLTGIFLGIQFLTTAWGGAQGHRIEPISLPVASSIPESLQAVLDPQGTRLIDALGEVECEVWWAKAIPTQKKASARGVFYNSLAVGTLLGIIHFPKPGH